MLELLESEHPYSGEPALYGRIETTDEVGQAARLALETDPSIRFLFLIVTQMDLIPAGGTTVLSHYFRYSTELGRGADRTGDVSNVETAEERDFVRNLISRAILDGAIGGGRRLSEADSMDLAQSVLSGEDELTPVSMVARRGESLVGHATFFPSWSEPFFNDEYTRLFDVFVLEEHRSTGVTQDLIGCVVADARSRGEDLLAEVSVDLGGSWRGVAESILSHGWVYDHSLLEIDLDFDR